MRRYLALLAKHLVLTKAVTSALLTCVGNLICQVFGYSSKTSRVDKSSDICTFDLCWRFDLPSKFLSSI
ncbi:hypothetical protein V6Z11_A13G135700 [Gossypium hirsutum]